MFFFVTLITDCYGCIGYAGPAFQTTISNNNTHQSRGDMNMIHNAHMIDAWTADAFFWAILNLRRSFHQDSIEFICRERRDNRQDPCAKERTMAQIDSNLTLSDKGEQE